jgi:hypothetical protein
VNEFLVFRDKHGHLLRQIQLYVRLGPCELEKLITEQRQTVNSFSQVLMMPPLEVSLF